MSAAVGCVIQHDQQTARDDAPPSVSTVTAAAAAVDRNADESPVDGLMAAADELAAPSAAIASHKLVAQWPRRLLLSSALRLRIHNRVAGSCR